VINSRTVGKPEAIRATPERSHYYRVARDPAGSWPKPCAEDVNAIA
jgi:hypothetical protein